MTDKQIAALLKKAKRTSEKEGTTFCLTLDEFVSTLKFSKNLAKSIVDTIEGIKVAHDHLEGQPGYYFPSLTENGKLSKVSDYDDITILDTTNWKEKQKGRWYAVIRQGRRGESVVCSDDLKIAAKLIYDELVRDKFFVKPKMIKFIEIRFEHDNRLYFVDFLHNGFAGIGWQQSPTAKFHTELANTKASDVLDFLKGKGIPTTDIEKIVAIIED